MPDAIDAIRVEGLREFQASLKAIDGQSQRALRVMLNEAAEIVVVAARKRAPVRTGRLRNSIRATSQQRFGVVSGGGARVPYFGATDYGNRRGAGRGVGRSDAAGLPFIATGRILYPAYLTVKPGVEAALNAGLTRLIEQHGLVVTHGG